jgi:membrane protein implicated in regulation of membrane protease activity
MLEALTYVSLISGGLLVLILLASIIGGLDWDFELDGAGDDGGGGYLKPALTFISIGSWVVKIVLTTSANPFLAFVAGGLAGGLAAFLLIRFLRFLLAQQSEVNWSAEDALFASGTVYLRIPEAGTGIVRIKLRGGEREFKARSVGKEEIPTGTDITVEGLEEDLLIVRPALADIIEPDLR